MLGWGVKKQLKKLWNGSSFILRVGKWKNVDKRKELLLASVNRQIAEYIEEKEIAELLRG